MAPNLPVELPRDFTLVGFIASGCSHVGMEATGVYWKPVWQVLADRAFELVFAQCRTR